MKCALSIGRASSPTVPAQQSVGAVNQTPINTVPAAQTVNEDVALVFSTGNSNAISVNDVGEYIRHQSCDRRFYLRVHDAREVDPLPFFERHVVHESADLDPLHGQRILKPHEGLHSEPIGLRPVDEGWDEDEWEWQ